MRRRGISRSHQLDCLVLGHSRPALMSMHWQLGGVASPFVACMGPVRYLLFLPPRQVTDRSMKRFVAVAFLRAGSSLRYASGIPQPGNCLRLKKLVKLRSRARPILLAI